MFSLFAAVLVFGRRMVALSVVGWAAAPARAAGCHRAVSQAVDVELPNRTVDAELPMRTVDSRFTVLR